MPQEINWKERASSIIKAEIKRRGFTYEMLVQQLAKSGADITATNLRTKLSRGQIGFPLVLQIMDVLEVQQLDLADNTKANQKK